MNFFLFLFLFLPSLEFFYCFFQEFKIFLFSVLVFFTLPIHYTVFAFNHITFWFYHFSSFLLSEFNLLFFFYLPKLKDRTLILGYF